MRSEPPAPASKPEAPSGPATDTRLRVLLVDDEAAARSRLRHFLRQEPDAFLVGECSNGAQAVQAITEIRPDVVFLDVQMPRLDGFAVCRTVGEAAMPPVVFVTAYDHYALKAFEVHAVDYLLKPFDRARFQQVMEHLRRRVSRPPTLDYQRELRQLLQSLQPAEPPPERMAVKTDGRLVFLDLADIRWVEAEGNYVKFHTSTATLLVRETLTWCEERLPHHSFLRISRSVLLNSGFIQEVQPLFYGDHTVILRDGTRLTLSRTHRDALDRLLARTPTSGLNRRPSRIGN